MDELIDLIAMAFKEGCGTTVESVMRSSRYKPTLHQYKSAPKRFRQDGEGNVVNMGLWEFSCGVNTLGLTTTKAMKSPPANLPADPSINALLEILGSKLIKTAGVALPASITEIIAQWKTADAEKQQELAVDASKIFRSLSNDRDISTRRPPDFTVEGDDVAQWLSDLAWLEKNCERYEAAEIEKVPVLSIWEKDYKYENNWFYQYLTSDSLPLAFLQEDGIPNCLGLAMLLCAFAEEIGSPYLLCSYLEHRTRAPSLRSITAPQDEINLLVELELPFEEEHAVELLEENPALVKSWAAEALEDFHYCIVIQLADKKWLLVDPYQKTVAHLPDNYGVDEAQAILESYQTLYPGMTVLCSDGGRLHDALESIDRLYEECAIRTSRMLEPLLTYVVSPNWAAEFADSELHESPIEKQAFEPDDIDFRELLEETEDGLWFEELIRQIPVFETSDLAKSELYNITTQRNSRIVDIYEKLGKELWDKHITEIVTDAATCDTLDFDEESFEDTKARLFGSTYSIITEVVKPLIDGVWSGFVFPHPVIEVFNPHHGLALALLNQLKSWTNNTVNGTVLLGYGASQQYWHEAADLSTSLEIADSLPRIEDLVRQLPHHYPLVQNKLDHLQQARSTANAEEPERDGDHSVHEGNQQVAGRGAGSFP